MTRQTSTKSIKVRPWTYGKITQLSLKDETVDQTLTRILVDHEHQLNKLNQT